MPGLIVRDAFELQRTLTCSKSSKISLCPSNPLNPVSSKESPDTFEDQEKCSHNGIGTQLKVASENGSTGCVSIENGCERMDSDLKLQDRYDLRDSSLGTNTEEHELPKFDHEEPPLNGQQNGANTDISGSASSSLNGSMQVSEKQEGINAENGHVSVLQEVEESNKAGKQHGGKSTSHKQRLSTPQVKRRSLLSSNGHSVSVQGDKRESGPGGNISTGLFTKDNKSKQNLPNGVQTNHTKRKGKVTEKPSRVQPEQSPARVLPGSLVVDSPRSLASENPLRSTIKISPSAPSEDLPDTPFKAAGESDPDREKAQRKFKEFFLQNKSGMSFGGSKAMRMLKGNENYHRALTDDDDAGPHNPDLGPFLFMLAKTTIASGDNPHKALDFAIRAAKSFEKTANGKPSLELVMSLHMLAAIHCTLGQFKESIPVLEHSIRIPDVEAGGIEHALAAFAGHMQLGDTFALLGRSEDAIAAYHAGLEVQKLFLGDMDPRVGETCRYLAEAHGQAMQFNEAEELCQHALDIHKQHSPPASVAEATDRRLMGLICNGKGEYEAALEHLVLASMALIANGLDVEVAAVDCSIGDTYVLLGRFDEAIFAYQKSLTVFKSAKGENHGSVASVYACLAELYLKTGKLRESKTYCESALRIYGRYGGGHQLNDVANGLTEIAAVYEALNEPEQAFPLLQKALGMLEAAPGQQSAAAGVEAQIGVLYYMAGKHREAYAAFRNAVTKLRDGAERKSSLLGVVLNQMGLVCVQLYRVDEAAEMFEEARSILDQSCGRYHPDTLAVYSNLAGAYDALGRLDDAINVLQYVVEVREEKLGTANPEVDDERRRLAELLKEAGRARARRPNGTLELLMETNSKQAGGARGRSIATEHQHSPVAGSVVQQERIEVAAH